MPTSGFRVDHSVLPSAITTAAQDHRWLLSEWVPFVLALATLVTIGLAGYRALARRAAGRSGGRRWPRRVGVGMLVLWLALLTVAAGVNSYAEYFPTAGALWGWATGSAGVAPRRSVTTAIAGTPSIPQPTVSQQVTSLGRRAAPTTGAWALDQVRMTDHRLGISDRTVYVLLPPGYSRGAQRYPVAYLLSGYPGRPSDWLLTARATRTVSSLVTARRLPPMILVLPDVNGGFFTDSETLDAVRGPQVQTWLTDDVVGYVDTHYRTLTDRADRLLGGMSSGGYAALNVALRHQDEFGLILALEPYGDPGNVLHSLMRNRLDLYKANSPAWYLPDIPLHRLFRTFVDVGATADDTGRVEALANLLAGRGEPVTLRYEPGQGHTWGEAVRGLPYGLADLGAYVGAPVLDQTFAPARFPSEGAGARLSLQDRPTGLPFCSSTAGRRARLLARPGGPAVCRGSDVAPSVPPTRLSP